jgi:hypothetical protein
MQPTSSVIFRVPDFVDADGIEYTDIEVIVEMDGDIRDTVQLFKTLRASHWRKGIGIPRGGGCGGRG